MRVGIIGAGDIAGKAADTLNHIEQAHCLAIGSRSLEKAQAFADRWGIPRAYGSYDALLDDPDIDLVYVATPHSHHFDVTKRALLKGKPCLVEKSFMANARETREILDLAHQRNIFIAEAIWTRYLPMQDIARKLIADGAIGKVYNISANLAYSMAEKERVLKPELCGGSLLDLGVYCLNHIRMFDSSPITGITSSCNKLRSGVDGSETIVMNLASGVLATAWSSVESDGFNVGVVAGEDGYLVFDNVNNPTLVSLYRKGHILEREYPAPPQYNGFEHQFLACKHALDKGLPELEKMPHSEILYIMELMDSLRTTWGVHYPMD